MAVMAVFRGGDKVMLCGNLEKLQRLQENHGGFNPLIKANLGEVGLVREVDEDGDVTVSFDDMNWCLNPKLLTKRFRIGEQVTLNSDEAIVKQLQDDHGGWNDGMRKAMSTVGKVVDIDEDGDVKVDFGGTPWTLNPNVCHRAAEKAPPLPMRSKSINQDVPLQTPSSGLYDNDRGLGRNASAGKSLTTGNGFSIGDYIILDKDMEFVKKMQKGHGGWSKRLIEAMTAPKQIVKIDRDGDLKVQVGKETWTFNPAVCHPVSNRDAASPTRPVGGHKLPGMTESDYQFAVDEEVNLKVSTDRLRELQRGHGGWNQAMKGLAGKVGTVRQVAADGDVTVRFHCGKFVFNPAALVSVHQDPVEDTRRHHDKGMKTSNYMTPSMTQSRPEFGCKVCHQSTVSVVFNCGHACCSGCAATTYVCHICGLRVNNQMNLYM